MKTINLIELDEAVGKMLHSHKLLLTRDGYLTLLSWDNGLAYTVLLAIDGDCDSEPFIRQITSDLELQDLLYVHEFIELYGETEYEIYTKQKLAEVESKEYQTYLRVRAKFGAI